MILSREKLDINEACKKVLRPEKPEDRCPFANKVKKIASESEPYSTNMDVEELIRFGMRKKGNRVYYDGDNNNLSS